MARKSKSVPKINPNDIKQTILSVSYKEEMSTSYIDYAMSVIAGRAFPDVRDGLKPVQRRTLYGMYTLGIKSDSPHRKSARIVGETMGKFHPHGDSSIYGSLVNMAQDWVYLSPFVDGHGNFGSIEGDGAAAMRYTEARPSVMTSKYFYQGINHNMVDFIPNFDETEKEPTLLPSKIPSLLISGTEGIGCGMASKMPSHNIGEVIEAVIQYMDKPKITVEELMQYIKGPDFATGGIVANKKDLIEIYKTGTGKIKVRGKIEVEESSNGKVNLVVTEIPYTMIGSIDKFLDSVADLIRAKTLSDVVDIRNESSKEGIRLIFELKKGADVQKNINIIYKKTKLEDTFGMNNLAVKGLNPKVFSLKELIQEFVEFQYEIYEREFRFLLADLLEKKEVKEGLITACDCIDLIIEILRGSKKTSQAKDCLMTGNISDINFKTAKSKKDASKLHFTQRQAEAILAMKLQQLIGLEILSLQKDYEDICKEVDKYQGLLDSKAKTKTFIKKQLVAAQKELAKPRKTEVIDAEEIVLAKEEIVEQDYIALMDRFGYIKIVDTATYSRNEANIATDYKYVIKTKNTEKIHIFTDKGKVYAIKVLDIPLGKYKDKGTPIENISNFTNDEQILLICTSGDIFENKMLFVNNKGMSKIVLGSEFNVTTKAAQASKLKDGESVVNISILTDDIDEIIVSSKEGYFIRFKLEEIPIAKKTSVGVKSINMKNEEDVIQNVFIGNSKSTFIIDENENPFTKIKLTKRAGVGTKSRL